MSLSECTISELLPVLRLATEEELRQAINFEVSAYRRRYQLIRMHQRYCRLRDARERKQLLAGETLL